MNRYLTSSLFVGAFVFASIVISTQNQPDLVITYGSPEERILRYVSKMELNKTNPSWENSAAVQRAKRAGELDYATVKAIFIEQQITTAEQFDAALQNLRTHQLIHPTQLKVTPKGLQAYNDIKAAQEAANTPVSPPATTSPTTTPQ